MSNNYRYVGIEDLPQQLFIKISSINAEFLNNRAGEKTAGLYFVPITEIARNCQHIGTGALLIIF